MDVISISNNLVHRVIVSILAGFVMLMAIPQAASAQTDPFIGTWRLNVAKSTFVGQQPWRSASYVVEPATQGFTHTNDIVTANGNQIKNAFPVIYDGQPHAVSNNANADSIAVRRIDPSNVEFTILKDGKAVQTGRIALSQDGRTATWITANSGAQLTARMMVFEKQ